MLHRLVAWRVRRGCYAQAPTMLVNGGDNQSKSLSLIDNFLSERLFQLKRVLSWLVASVLSQCRVSVQLLLRDWKQHVVGLG
jgi:hypothetical protein